VQQEISILGLIMEASLVVQLVMLSLVIASIVSWYFIFQRATFFKQAQQAKVS
jgi:biopolymer transport protein TolQ